MTLNLNKFLVYFVFPSFFLFFVRGQISRRRCKGKPIGVTFCKTAELRPGPDVSSLLLVLISSWASKCETPKMGGFGILGSSESQWTIGMSRTRRVAALYTPIIRTISWSLEGIFLKNVAMSRGGSHPGASSIRRNRPILHFVVFSAHSVNQNSISSSDW